VKQTARRRRRYVAMPSSSSSVADTPPTGASSEETLSNVAAEELRAGDTVEFGVSRMSSVRVQDMQQLGYFGGGVARVPVTEEVPEPEGELVVFEAFLPLAFICPRINLWEKCWGEGKDATLRSRPSLDSAPDEGLRRRHPTVRPRPAQRPTCDPAHCNGPCVAAACYGPNL
jgi:hypothetical protein